MNGMEAFATIELPADIGKRQLATLRCKVDTGAGGNVMPLRAFSKLFPERFNTDGHPTGLTPSTNAYLPTMAPQSSNMEHSTPTSTGHQKVPRPPTTSTHDGLLLTHPDQQYWDSQHATDSES